MAQSRSAEIIERASELMRRFHAWQQSSSIAISAGSPLADAIKSLIAITEDGDTPKELAVLCVKVMALKERWDAYGNDDFRPKTGEPMPHFYSCVRELGNELVAAMRGQQDERTPVYPVAHFVTDGLSPSQIAGQYSAFDEDLGYQVGPFHYLGRVVEEWVREEISNPGCRITAQFVHPRDTMEQDSRKRRLLREVKSVEAVLETSKSEEARKIKPKPTRETVLQLLSEKLFPRQIMLDYDITEPEIDAIAMGAGIAVENHSKPSSQPQSQEPTQEQPLAAAPASAQTEKPLAERLKDRVAEIMQDSPDATSNDIAETLSDELGQVVKPASVNAIMTNIKRRQQQPSA